MYFLDLKNTKSTQQGVNMAHFDPLGVFSE